MPKWSRYYGTHTCYERCTPRLGFDWECYNITFDIAHEWWHGKKLAHTPTIEAFLWLVLNTHSIPLHKCHTCSIGFGLRDWGGQVSISKFCIDNHCLTNFAVCSSSLSCWDMTREGLKQHHPIVFMTPSWRMLRYRACAIFPSILHMQPMS